jgi:hypothetical protein
MEGGVGGGGGRNLEDGGGVSAGCGGGGQCTCAGGAGEASVKWKGCSLRRAGVERTHSSM